MKRSTKPARSKLPRRKPPRPKPKRAYRMTARAAAAEDTRQRIVFAAFQLFLERYYDEVGLKDVASRAGVSQATILRAFGTKEGVTRAVSEVVARAFDALDSESPADLPSALDVLVANYDATGDAFVRLIALEGRLQEVQYALDAGRQYHHRWVERVFAAELAALDEARRAALFAQLFVLTDLMVWKLLRRDLGLSSEETRARLESMIVAVLAGARASRFA